MLLENKVEQEEIIKIEEVEASTEEVVTPKKKRAKKKPKQEVVQAEESEVSALTKQIESWKNQ